MSFSGHELRQHNEQIVKCITELKKQRNELTLLIDKQLEEKVRLETDIQRLNYKLSLVSKSVAQRLTTRINYDRTIQQAEENYIRLVETSGLLLDSVQREAGQLEQIMDKKTSTDDLSVPDKLSNDALSATLSNERKNSNTISHLSED